MKTQNFKKITSFVALGFFALVGTYNAVVINSDSHISSSDIKFVKRLDELNGVVIPGRVVAAATQWQKLEVKKQKVVIAKVSNTTSNSSESAPVEITPAAAVAEELNLNLVEVINPKKWQNGLTASQFNGTLSTNDGIIESLDVALPNGEGVSVSFSEMTGNVFEYDFNGELYSGMMYQVDQDSYMVTLSNGPLEGTRFRFSSKSLEVQAQDTQNYLADNNVEVGNFGETSADQNVNYDEQFQAQAQNFDQPTEAL